MGEIDEALAREDAIGAVEIVRRGLCNEGTDADGSADHESRGATAKSMQKYHL